MIFYALVNIYHVLFLKFLGKGGVKVGKFGFAANKACHLFSKIPSFW